MKKNIDFIKTLKILFIVEKILLKKKINFTIALIINK